MTFTDMITNNITKQCSLLSLINIEYCDTNDTSEMVKIVVMEGVKVVKSIKTLI